MCRNGNDYKKLSFRQSLRRNLYVYWRFPLKPCRNDIRKFKSYSTISITLTILILFSSVIFAQTNSLHYQGYLYIPVISDTLIIEIEIKEIPKITGGDIGGQLLFSPISGIIFAVIGGLAGTVIDSGIPYDPSASEIIGVLAGYSFGSALGVYVAASNKKYDTNLLGLIGSSILGEVVGVYLYSLSNADTPDANVLAFAPLVLPPIFAIITLNAFQQKKSNIQVGFDIQQLPQPNAYSYGIKLQYAF